MFFKKRKPYQPIHPFDLDYPLVQLSGYSQDTLTLEDFATGCFITGSSGSGKTTGPGAHIARAFLRAGYGGLVLTVKPGDRAQWEQWCRQTGRLDDLVVMDDTARYRFNFMQYESQRTSPGGGLTSNLANLFVTIMEATDSGQANAHDQFWRLAVKQLLKNTIDLLLAADEELSITNLKRVVISSPDHPERLHDANWAARSYCIQCLEATKFKVLSEDRRIDLDEVERYFLVEGPGQDSDTRANVIQTFSVMADGFCRDLFRKLFSTDLNITPEWSSKGKIILLDIPVKTHNEAGRTAQVAWKYLWQQAMERRQTESHDKRIHPAFLYMDEFQEFATSNSDALFQATARSSRVCTVCLTQSIAGLYNRMGGHNGKHAVDALLANMSIKVMCACGCPENNRWAEDLINKKWRYRGQSSVSFNNQQAGPKKLLPDPVKPQISGSVSPSLESQILPTVFTKLKSGGRRNTYQAETIVSVTSRVWARTRANYLPVTFLQEF